VVARKDDEKSMNSRPKPNERKLFRGSAFTLIEVLVVIASQAPGPFSFSLALFRWLGEGSLFAFSGLS